MLSTVSHPARTNFFLSEQHEYKQNVCSSRSRVFTGPDLPLPLQPTKRMPHIPPKLQQQVCVLLCQVLVCSNIESVPVCFFKLATRRSLQWKMLLKFDCPESSSSPLFSRHCSDRFFFRGGGDSNDSLREEYGAHWPFLLLGVELERPSENPGPSKESESTRPQRRELARHVEGASVAL